MPCECDAENVGCLCTFTAGLNVTITGSGTPADPVTINVNPMFLQVVDGVNTDLTLLGTGDVSNPYLLRIDVVGGGSGASLWTRWTGSRVAYDLLPVNDDNTLYVVMPGA